MHLHIAGYERSVVDGMPASLVCVGIVQVHLGRFNLVKWAGTGKIFKLHQGALVRIVWVPGYQEVPQLIIVAC